MFTNNHNHNITDTIFLSAIITLFIFPIISCTNPATKESYERGLSKWKNIPASVLIAEWGLPQNSYPLEDGGKIIEYVRESQILISRYECVTIPRGPFRHHFYDDCEESFPVISTMMSKTEFFVDPNGIIYRYRWKSGSYEGSSTQK